MAVQVNFNRAKIEVIAADKWRRTEGRRIVASVVDECPQNTGAMRKRINGRLIGKEIFEIRVSHPAAKWVINGRGFVIAGGRQQVSRSGRTNTLVRTGAKALWWNGRYHGRIARPSKPNDFIRRGMRKAGLRNVT